MAQGVLLCITPHPDQEAFKCWSNWAMMVMSVDEAFHYLSPSFAVLEVEFSQIRIEGYKAAGDAEN